MRLVPAIARKLASTCVFHGLMDVSEVLPGKSAVCLHVREAKQQKQQLYPQVGPLHPIGKGMHPSYRPIPKLPRFSAASSSPLISHRDKLALRCHDSPTLLAQKPTSAGKTEPATAAGLGVPPAPARLPAGTSAPSSGWWVSASLLLALISARKTS